MPGWPLNFIIGLGIGLLVTVFVLTASNVLFSWAAGRYDKKERVSLLEEAASPATSKEAHEVAEKYPRYDGRVYCQKCGTSLEKFIIGRKEGFDEWTGLPLVIDPGQGFMVCGYFHAKHPASGYVFYPTYEWDPFRNGHAVWSLPKEK